MSTMLKVAGLSVLILWSLSPPTFAQADTNANAAGSKDVEIVAESTVGMPKRIDAVVWPGEPLVVRPMEDRHQPFVLRIIDTYKHGTDHRYDIEFYSLEVGDYNVSDFLIRADGSQPDGLKAVWVRIGSTLAEGQITPGEPPSAPLPRLGGYWLLWTLGGIIWIAGLAVLLLSGRGRKIHSDSIAVKPVTMAERLRPLVHAAMSGNLDSSGQAELERTLIAYWCKRLDLQATSPGEAIGILRKDPQAGPLLTSLEDWLHRPDPPVNVDVEKLLEPYRNVSDGDQDNGTTLRSKHHSSPDHHTSHSEKAGAMVGTTGDQA